MYMYVVYVEYMLEEKKPLLKEIRHSAKKRPTSYRHDANPNPQRLLRIVKVNM